MPATPQHPNSIHKLKKCVFLIKKHIFISFCILIAVCMLAFAARHLYLQPKSRSLLIVACARSGTTYITEALQQKGLQVRHEVMGKDGICSWPLAVNPKEGRWKARPGDYRFAHVFHQVRDPLRVISSVYVTEDRDSWYYIMQHLPQILVSDPHLVKCAKYWYYWNLEAEKISEWTYQVEKVDSNWSEFEKHLGKKLNATELQLPKNMNSRQTEGRKYFTWQDLKRELDPTLYYNIQQLAKKYGYSVSESYDECCSSDLQTN